MAWMWSPGVGWGAESLELCLESCGPFSSRARWEPHLILASGGGTETF